MPGFEYGFLQVMTLKIVTNGSHHTRDSKSNLHDKNDREKTFREHRCGAGQTLSESQVRIRLFTLEH